MRACHSRIAPSPSPGQTLPFGSSSFDPDKVLFLSSEQALADFAELLGVLLPQYNVPNAPVVAFGGSYGGMLSAWFRQKYPNVVAGAIASSAPVLQFPGLVDPGLYNSIITNDFTAASPRCTELLRATFNDAIPRLAQSSSGRSLLSSSFRLCNPIIDDGGRSAQALSDWLNQGIQYMAMTDYPYPSNFLQPMPGWPVKEMCRRILNGTPSSGSVPDAVLLPAVRDGIAVYYNYTNQYPKCFDTSAPISPSLGDKGWDYQACRSVPLALILFQSYPLTLHAHSQRDGDADLLGRRQGHVPAGALEPGRLHCGVPAALARCRAASVLDRNGVLGHEAVGHQQHCVCQRQLGSVVRWWRAVVRVGVGGGGVD